MPEGVDSHIPIIPFLRTYRDRVIRAFSYDMQVLADVLIRHPEPQEHNSVRALVTTVANETFGDLFAPSPVPLKLEDDDWSLAWVAVSGAKIVGVVLTR